MHKHSAQKSSDKANPPTLCFSSQQDALDFARHSAENACRRLVGRKLDMVKSYRENEADIVLNICCLRTAKEYDLVFRAVPLAVGWAEVKPRLASNLQRALVGKGHDGSEYCMYGISHLVEEPKGIIPSFVWLEPAKQRQNLIWQILANFPSNDGFQAGEIVCNREVGTFRVHLSSGDSTGVSSLIQTGAQRQEGLGRDIFADIRQAIRKPNSVNLRNTIRIHLTERGVWLLLSESGYDGFKFGNPIVCAL